MWSISEVIYLNRQISTVAMSDGKPLDAQRNDPGGCVRLFFGAGHYLDITDIGDTSGGTSALIVNDIEVSYTSPAAFRLTILPVPDSGTLAYTCSFDGTGAPPIPFRKVPAVSADDICTVKLMEALGILPYRNDPNGCKTPAQIKALANQFFPFMSDNYERALSIYDWTTADFFRMDLFNIYTYSAEPWPALNDPQIAEGIWTSNWATYKPSDPDFMNSFLMQPAGSLSDVAAQLNQVGGVLATYLAALRRVTVASKATMPRISTMRYPALFSGQVAIQNLGMDAMAAYFEEYPASKGPAGAHQGMPIAEALQGFMAPGNTLTFRTFISFTDDRPGAMHYSNGILLALSPPAGITWGDTITYITPLSDENSKIEYTLSPGARVKVTGTHMESGQNGEITVIDMTLLP